VKGWVVHATPLRQRDFALLWWAGLISVTGNWALTVALPLAVLRLTGSPAAVSTVVAAGLAGNLLFGAFAGAYVDRWDRRRVVVLVNGLQAVALLPLLLVDAADRVWVAAAVAFVSSALTQFSQPAENALLPRLVSAADLPAANALNTLNNNVGRLVGPAVGGFAAVTLGLAGTALLDAATFAAAAALCALIRGVHRADRSGEPPRHLLRELAEGLAAIGRDRVVRAIAVLIAVIMVGEGIMGTLFAVYATEALGGDGRLLGWMMTAQAVGGVLGSLLATRVISRFPPVPLIATSFTVGGLVDLAIFNYPRWDTAAWPALVLFGLVGVPIGIHVSALWTLFQTRMPDRLRGRTFAAIWVGGALAGIAGAALAGALGDRVGVLDLLTVSALGLTASGILFRLVAGPGPTSLVPPRDQGVPDVAPATSGTP
jgi:MFS family permease